MLERILGDRRECEVLESFLHSEYKIELLYFLRSCDKFEVLVHKYVSIEAVEGRANGNDGGITREETHTFQKH